MIRNIIAICLAISASFLLNFDAIAKPKYPREDRGAWGTISLKYNLTETITLELDQELRYYNNYKVLEQTLTDFGASYKFNDWLKAGMSYRYKSYFDEDSDKDQYAQEAHLNISLRQKFYGFAINNRIRLQARFKEIEDDSYFFRNKLSLEYKDLAKWVSPFVSAELYHKIASGSENKVNKARYAIGLNFEPFDNHEIGVYFLRENEHNKKKIVNSNIVGLEYKLELN